MKKIIFKLASFFVVICLVFSSVGASVVSAETQNTITLDTLVELTLGEWNFSVLDFTPQESGVYKFYSVSDYATYGYVAYYEGNSSFMIESEYGYNNFNIYVYLEAGKKYSFTASHRDYGTKTFNVGLTLTNISSVEIEDVTIYEGLDANIQSEYNYDTGAYDIHWQRHYYYPEFTVYLKDGTSISSNESIYYQDLFLSTSDDQSYENQWSEGSYTATGTVWGVSDTFTVTLLPNPVDRVVINDVTLYEVFDGYRESEYNYDTGEYDLYWQRYYYYPEFTVYFKDGSSKVTDNGINYNNNWYSLQKIDNQSYQNQFKVGANTVTATIMGVSDSFNVNLLENPIESVEVEDVTVIEGIDSSRQSYYDPDTGNWDKYYNKFYYQPAVNVKFKDGSTLSDNGGIFFNNKWYSINCSDSQNYDNEWRYGDTHLVNGSFLGFDISFNVTVGDYAYKSIEIISINAMKETDYSYIDSNGNRIYNIPDFTYKIVFKNGSFITREYKGSNYYSNYDYKHSNIEVSSNQNITPWTVGGANTVTVACGNISTEFSVKIIDESDWEYVEQNGEIYITNCSIAADEITVPDTIDGLPVVGIMSLGNNGLATKVLNIPDTVKYISEEAFSGDILNTVNLGNSEAVVTNNTFKNCYSLNDITVSDTNKHYSIYDGVLYNKTGETLIAYPIGKGYIYTVPDQVADISSLWSEIWGGYYLNNSWHISFDFTENSKALKKVDGVTYTTDMTTVVNCDGDKTGDYIMPNTVTKVAAEAFMSSKLSAVSISNKVTELVYFSFGLCSKLETVVMPNSLTSIDYKAFYGSNLKNVTELPNSLKYIGSSAFENTSLESITIPSSVTEWGDYSFAFSSLKEVNLSEGLKGVGPYSFSHTDITDVAFPSSMSHIENGAFAYTKINKLDLPSNIKTIGDYSFEGTLISNLIIPNTIIDIGNGSFSNTQIEALELPNSISNINSYAFAGTKLTTVLIPESVIFIGDGAFTRTPLKEIDIPKNVTHIGSYAFSSTEITTLDIPNTVTYVGSFAFEGTPLKDVKIGEGISEISSGTFCGTLLTSVSIPENISVIGDYAFESTKLSNVEFNCKKVSIGNSAFANCPLDKTELSANIISIGEYAFAGTLMTSVKIPDSVTDITYHSFAGSEKLAEIDIPDNLEHIDGTAFNGTAWLDAQENGVVYLENALYGYKYGANDDANIVVKDGIHVVADYAFDNNSRLKSITLPEGMKTIGDYAFYRCTSLTDIYIPNSVKNIGKDAFDLCINLTITGYRGSVAEKYANERGIPFIALVQSGDILSDGEINNRDLACLMQWLNGWEIEITEESADVNGDGSINNKDYALLMQYVNGWDVELK